MFRFKTVKNTLVKFHSFRLINERFTVTSSRNGLPRYFRCANDFAGIFFGVFAAWHNIDLTLPTSAHAPGPLNPKIEL